MAHHPLAMQLPLATGPTASKGIELFTWGTPNGFKASILLEELKAAYGTDYTVTPIALHKAIQKQAWFLSLNPNGKVPVIIDHDAPAGPLSIAESPAIFQYLARTHDPKNLFSFPPDAPETAKVEQWLAFMAADLSPTATGAVKFYRFLPVRHPFPTAMYHREALRQFAVLDAALAHRHFLVGTGQGKYSVADMGLFAFVNNSCFLGIGPLDSWPNLHAWWARIWDRDPVRKGVDVPYPALSVNALYQEKWDAGGEWREKEEKLREALHMALEENPPVGSGPPVAAPPK